MNDRVGDVSVERVLAAGGPRTQSVKTQAGDHRGQPPPQVVDGRSVGAAQPEPAFLDGVLRFTDRSEHAVGHRPHVRPVRFELAGAMTALPRGGWRALGVVEMLCGILLVVPGATGWMPHLTALAAAVLTVETLALAAFYASYSLTIAATNPLVWAVVMALLVAIVAYGRYAPSPAI